MPTVNQPLPSLFLSQSYQDTWEDYIRSLSSETFACWDFIVLTASNDHQAHAFNLQLAQRSNQNHLPSRTRFLVISDPDGQRIGSGGATLAVLSAIAKERKNTDFSGIRILVIHSGGDSKRIPQYSALGKLFSPVPRQLPDGRPSTLFDELLAVMASVPPRLQHGMVTLSGDVLLLFNPLQIDYSGKDAAAISFKEDVSTGCHHGVFLSGPQTQVARFLHKYSPEKLRQAGAVNNRNQVDIDTGAIIFSPLILNALLSLIWKNGKPDKEQIRCYLNSRVRLSLYGDFLYPMAADSTIEDFQKESPEGDFCPELSEARNTVWNLLRPFRLNLIRLAPAKFIHFGTNRELLSLMTDHLADYKMLGWKKQLASCIETDSSGYLSIAEPDAQIGTGCFLEAAHIHSKARIGNHVILSHVEITDETIPDGIILHGIRQLDGTVTVRIYAIDDNPKKSVEDCPFLGSSLSHFMAANGICPDELWAADQPRTLWNARLYPLCPTMKEAVKAALNIYALVQGHGDLPVWRNASRTSLATGFSNTDTMAILAWERSMADIVQMTQLAHAISENTPLQEVINCLHGATELSEVQTTWLENHLKTTDFPHAMRIHFFLSKLLKGQSSTLESDRCFQTIRDRMIESFPQGCQFNPSCHITKEFHRVALPLRVNWGGGWSDTPPYCLEHGGTVLNAAITLNGAYPVDVYLQKINSPKIIIESTDMNAYREFDAIAALQDVGNPFDPFVLQKAALMTCGIIPVQGGHLPSILARMGGGFIIKSEVHNVPKGSGLGTSSILGAACTKVLTEFTGASCSSDDLIKRVLFMEQLMSTGGGWQDQIGGLLPGIKFSSSRPGLLQTTKTEIIELDDKTKDELNRRFALIYTGQRRLARNLLRDVIGHYLGNEKSSLFAHNEIQRVAALMRFELLRGHVTDFAKLLDYHWTLSQQIDAGSTNTLINQIFASIDDLIDGRMVCGAGGGGFLQVIIKENYSKEILHHRLKNVFQDNAIDIWNCTIL